MGKWKMVLLGDIAKINMGQSPASETYNDIGEGLPFFQGKTDFQSMYPTIRMFCNAPQKTANKNDILISVRAPVGAVNIATQSCCIGRGLAAISEMEKVSYYRYLFYYLRYKKKNIANMGVGSTFKAISRKDINMFLIPLPPLDVQQKIADVLDRASVLIGLRKTQLDRLDLLIKSQFIQMFGDPVTNPKGWPQTTVGDIAEIKIGPFGTLLHKEDYIENGHALVNPSHIIDGKICIDPKLTITDEKYDELSAYKLKMGDIVLGRRGEMGRCAVVYEDGLLCGTGSMIIRSGQQIKPYFLHNILSSPTYKKIIEDKAVGVTMMNLNVPIVSSLQIPLLPIDLQEQFISFLKQVDKSKSALRQSLEKIELNYKSLMQKCFRGEIF